MQIELDDEMSELLDYVKTESGSKDNSEAIKYAIHLASAKFCGEALQSLQGSVRGDLNE